MNTTEVRTLLIEENIYFNHPLMKEKYGIYTADMMNFNEFYKAFLRNGLKITDENKISNCADKAFSLLEMNVYSLWENPWDTSETDPGESTFDNYINNWFKMPKENFDKFIDLVLLPSVA